MNETYNLLILTGALGEGHKQAARAILETSRLTFPDVEAEIVDFLQWTHPYLHSISRYCYNQWVTKMPSVYGYLFQKTRDDNIYSQIFKKIKLFGLARMTKLLHEKQPSVVVSTFPIASAAMSMLKTQGLTTVPTVTVITDHTDHSYWIHPLTDRYIVGSERVRRALLNAGVREEQIAVTGIPVRPSFSRSYDPSRLRTKHGLDRHLPTVLIMGGGLGMIGKDLLSLLRPGGLPGRMQFIIVCGHNKKRHDQLKRELQHSPHAVVVTGYVTHIHEYMALSDLIVTKPGGLTTAEAAALELPMLLYKPLPGQEQDNAAYLSEAGAAWKAESEADLLHKMTRLLQEPEQLMQMKKAARALRQKFSTERALNAILETDHRQFPYVMPRRRAIFARA